MKKVKLLLLALCTLTVVTPTIEAQTPSLDTLINHIRELSSSKYEGRLAGTDEYLSAADYVVEQLSQYGVQPYKGEWAQYFEIERNKIENCTFNSFVTDNEVRQVYVLGKDFCCAGMTGRGYAEAPVVFCGYGIDNGAFNEYEKVDAQGKIVMVLSGVPSFLPSSVTEKYQDIRDKARVAQKHGACALVVVNMNNACPSNEVQGNVYCGEGPHMATFPIIMPTRDCAKRLMKNELITFDEAVQALQNKQTPQSFHLRKKFSIDVNTTYHPAAITANVIGVYPGIDRTMSNEYVVVGAQLDGIGMQGTTCLFPGADNNNTGVAALLEVARMLTLSEDQPSRSIIFVFFSGSEQQHLGSQIFVSNFTPLKRIEAYVDASSIGTGDSIMVYGNGRFPDLWNVANKVDTLYCGNTMVRGIKTNPRGEALSFAYVGIPSINITHRKGNKHYHMPSDITENVNRDYIVRATQLLFETVLDLSFGEYQGRSNESKRIKFTN